MNAAPPAELAIEVAYAEAGKQALISMRVPAGTTADEALERSGLAVQFPEADFARCELGVWGHPVPHDHRLRDGDRLEIYRPLAMDPREARRQLASHGRAMGQKDTGEE